MTKKLVINQNDRPLTTSKQVGETFGKEHFHVLESIRDIENKVSMEFWESNFRLSVYKSRGKELPMYLMTKDGFAMLVMGYTGKDAMQFKELYIKKFNEMERFITSRNLARYECLDLTDNIKLMHEEPKFYHYSNELDMINKIVLGKYARDIRKEFGLSKTDSIRDFISHEDIFYIQKLQKADVGMVITVSDFYERKKALQNYYNMIRKNDNLIK